MPALIIDGKAIAKGITDQLKAEVAKTGLKPGLAVIRVGDDPASIVYVNKKVQMCEKLGFYSEKHELPAETSQDELLQLIEVCNSNQKLHGFFVQFPVPPHIDPTTIQSAIDPVKDADGLHPDNEAALQNGTPTIIPATPRGIMTLIHSVKVDLSGMKAVVIGRSKLVGKPVAQLLRLAGADVEVCHSQTPDVPAVTKLADILVSAVGRTPKMVTADYVKPGSIVIDVGIHRLSDGSLCGDVDFETVKEVAGFITPVPGGVGPMTIASLMQNTFDACKRLHQRT